MQDVVKVKNKLSTFIALNNQSLNIEVGNTVIVSTKKGNESGIVVRLFQEDIPTDLSYEINVIKVMTHTVDEVTGINNVYGQFFNQKKEQLQLNMKLIDVELSPDSDKILFYYVAQARIDFRELVKHLAHKFRKRIELRQVNDRERAKIVGGIGPCGYQLCCSQFLDDFAVVNVKMAKVQQLSFNLQRVTGVCDRLLCCLKYEFEQYKEMKQGLPDVGNRVLLKENRLGRVRSLQLLTNEITIIFDDYSLETFAVNDFLEQLIPRKQERKG